MALTAGHITHIRPGAGTPIQIGGFGTTVKIASELTSGSVSIVEHTLAPGLLGAPPHRHSREDETSWVIEGELTVQVGDEITVVSAGGIVLKPRGISHTFWNAGSTTVRFLEVIAPGGFEQYFVELGRLVPSDGPPDMGEITALAQRYGMTFDLAAMPALMQRHQLRMG